MLYLLSYNVYGVVVRDGSVRGMWCESLVYSTVRAIDFGLLSRWMISLKISNQIGLSNMRINSNDKYRKVIYRCNNKYADGCKCKTPHINEDELLR